MKRSLIVAAIAVGFAIYGLSPETPKVRRSFLSRAASSVMTESKAVRPEDIPVARAAAAQAPQNETVVERIRRLKACFDHSCDYPRRGPRDYEYALEADIAAELNEMSSEARANGLVSEEFSETAREFLSSTNAHLQLAALGVMASQPESPRNLKAILQGTILGANSDSTEAALNELRRYQDPRDLDTIAEFLSEAIAHGSPMIATEVAAGILPFIAPTNSARLAAFAQTLPADSHLRAVLEASIEEFYRLADGG